MRAQRQSSQNLPKQKSFHEKILKPAGLSRNQNSSKENVCLNQQTRNFAPEEKACVVSQCGVKGYIQGIIQHLRQNHQRNVPLQNPLKFQKEINSRMKGILTNWLIEVHQKFNLKQKTLFITMNIIE